MREERGQLSGDVVVYEPFTLWGLIGGNVTVIQGGKLYLRGSVYGNLTVEYGGRVHIYGNVTGNLKITRGAKVIHSGVIGGDAINKGGRLFVDAGAKIVGKIKTSSTGETQLDPKYQPPED
jgi:cytoskeletal protein CcmA (bactofilin family)